MLNINKTSQSSDSVEIIATEPNAIKIWVLCFSVFILASLLGTLLFIAVSWYKIPSWRQFKNYIFLNVIATLTLLDLSRIVYESGLPSICKDFSESFSRLATMAFTNWLLIMCVVIYTKIIKVFSGTLQHKYYKANAFAWGLAFFQNVTSDYIQCPSLLYIMHLMTYIILGFYLSIVYALVKLTLVRMVSHDNSYQIVRIFVYVTSAFSILILMQVMEYFEDIADVLIIGVLCMQLVFLVAFLSMKSHREHWGEYLKGTNRDALDITD